MNPAAADLCGRHKPDEQPHRGRQDQRPRPLPRGPHYRSIA